MANNLLFTIGAKDNSAQVINKVKQNLKFLDQEYKNAKKGSKDFESTQDGLKAKLDMLSNKFEQTKIKLDAYNKKLEETKQKAADQQAALPQTSNDEDLALLLLGSSLMAATGLTIIDCKRKHA